MAALVVVTPATLYIIPSLSSGVAFSPSHSSLSYPERNGESQKRKEKKVTQKKISIGLGAQQKPARDCDEQEWVVREGGDSQPTDVSNDKLPPILLLLLPPSSQRPGKQTEREKSYKENVIIYPPI
jgi:hypothetical protein